MDVVVAKVVVGVDAVVDTTVPGAAVVTGATLVGVVAVVSVEVEHPLATARDVRTAMRTMNCILSPRYGRSTAVQDQRTG